MIKTCVIIGSGNVATHIARALSCHVEIRQVLSRDIVHARELATSVGRGCEAVDKAEKVAPDADLYLMAVTDDSIRGIVENINVGKEALWVHTSGSVGIDVFDGLRDRAGVFYPLQTFSKGKPVDMSQVPMFIEAVADADAESLMKLASQISGKVSRLGTEGRRRLHIAAVFACNFVNYMWSVADRQLHLCGTDIHALDPLLRETFEKISSLTPAEAQTGPARRGDKHVIDRHIGMLDSDDAKLYELISTQIYNSYHEQN